jgi:hypothetical protein
MKKDSNDIIFLTLIDFLIQLIFLGIVIGVLYSISQSSKDKVDPVKYKEEMDSINQIKKATGISDLTKLTDQLTRLGPMQDVSKKIEVASKLENSIKALGGLDQANKTLEDKIKKSGQGKPACLPNGLFLTTIDAYEDHLEIRTPLTSEFLALLNEIGVNDNELKMMTFNKFRTAFQPVLTKHPECRYNVKVMEYSKFIEPRDTVSSVFYVVPKTAK